MQTVDRKTFEAAVSACTTKPAAGGYMEYYTAEGRLAGIRRGFIKAPPVYVIFERAARERQPKPSANGKGKRDV